MFQVEMKNTPDIILDVYDIIKDKNGYPEFLVFMDNQWKYMSAKNFSPVGTFYKNIN